MEMVTTPQARELTDEERAQRAEVARSIEMEIKSALEQGREALWRLAKALYEFEQEQGWSALGYETQEQWLAQPDISMSRSFYFRLTRRYRELVVNRQLPTETLVELDPSKLDIVLPTIEAEEKPLDQVLEDVKSMGARDLRETYEGSSSGGSRGRATNGGPSGGAAATEQSKELQDAVKAAAAVESWLEMGGDRRKAQRNWSKLINGHPFFRSANVLDSHIDGGDDAPAREQALLAWNEFWGFLARWQ